MSNRTTFRHSAASSGTRPQQQQQQQDQTSSVGGTKRNYDGPTTIIQQGTKKRRAARDVVSNSQQMPVRIESAQLPGGFRSNDASRCYNNSNVVARMLAIGQFIEQLQHTPMIVNLVSEMMITNPMDFGLQLSGIRLLSECGSYQDATTYVHTITQAMRANPTSLILQLEGCAALRRRIKLDGGSLLVQCHREGGLLHTVIAAMILHAPYSRHLCFLGFDIIGMLVTCSVEYRQAVASNQTYVASFISMIRANLRDASILQVGLSTLSWLVEERQGRDTIADKGGVALVLDSMKAHPNDTLVQCNAAACLCWLIHTQNTAARETLAADSDGIKLLLDSLDRYSSSPSIFGNIMCILIGALIADSPRRDLQNAETVELAVRGMKQHEDSAKVRRNCLTLLRLLTMESPVCQRIVVDHVAPIQLAMQGNPEDSDTQSEACGILANICLLPEGRTAVSESGCIETVVTSQLQHRDCLRLQQIAAFFHSLLGNNATGGDVSAFGGGTNSVGQAMFADTGVLQQ